MVCVCRVSLAFNAENWKYFIITIKEEYLPILNMDADKKKDAVEADYEEIMRIR